MFSKVWDGKNEVDTSERDAAYTNRIDRLNNAEQYVLIANTHGNYQYLKCSDGKFFLNKMKFENIVYINPIFNPHIFYSVKQNKIKGYLTFPK